METEPSSPHLQASSIFLFFLEALTLSELVGALLLLAMLLLASAFVSGAEVAFFSLKHQDFDKLRAENSAPATRILLLKEKPRTLLATILIGNNFINIGIVLLSDYVLRNVFPPELLQSWAMGVSAMPIMSNLSIEFLSNTMGFLITVVGVTFLLVLFGEVVPKSYAKQHKTKLARFMSGPLMFMGHLFSPLSRTLVLGSNFLEKKLGNLGQDNSLNNREYIDEAIELTVQHELDSRQEVDILKSIVKFGDLTVRQIMRSRVDVVAVENNISYQELLEVVKESGYSRIPVYIDDFDHIVGILYAKDLLGHLREADDFEWHKLVRSNVLYVPEAKKIDDMLKEFQRQRNHMAIVVDEYGGTSGIVTLEDIMEEVVGEIRDEFDEEEELEYEKLDDLNYIFDGKFLLSDFCRVIGKDLSMFESVEKDADSLAGLILELVGQFPKQGSEHWFEGYKFKVVKLSKRRIEKIHVTLPKT